MRRAAPALAFAIAPVCLLACSLTLSFDGIDDGTRDASLDDGGSDSSLDRGAVDAADGTLEVADGADAAADSAPPDGGCPLGAPGPAMVPVTSYCIDSTEITADQYTVFLAAKGGDTSGQPPKCAWNTSYTPNNWPPSAPLDRALVGVDWCDARMYCEWAGKRLCGSIDGGSSDPSNWTNAAVSQWFRACAHNGDGVHVYPYGLTYNASACNGSDYDAGGPLPSLSTCEGAYPGLFDMSGNVFEWEDSCFATDPDASDQTGASDGCNIRGGAFGSGSGALRCDVGFSTARSNGGGDNGFRCCSK